MHLFILCGGNGTRMCDYSLPKPLNMIHGKPALSYCLENLPAHVKTLHFIVAPHLYDYNFEEIVINLFKARTCLFHRLPYFTRGPIESAWHGTKDISDDAPIVFLDNDVLYTFPEEFFRAHTTAFLGYSEDTSTSDAFSFLSLSGDTVISYKEKKRISNLFCCGVYGFKNINQFRATARGILEDPGTTELYMSRIYTKLLDDGDPIKAIQFPAPIRHVGSLQELRDSYPYIKKSQMRVCFDLDNTLVTYPTVVGDYSTVRPNTAMVELARKLHSEGHIIIIHTARRMTTHRYNVGAVMKDIAATTLRTLDDFEIPYDEILFGKPIADIYIDDRAVNPYRDSILSMGYVDSPQNSTPQNSLPTNRYNTIELIGTSVLKKGPSVTLRGEIFYYKSIPPSSAIAPYFPRYYDSGPLPNDTSFLKIENIPSIPLYTLFKSELITQIHIQRLFEFTDILHHFYTEAPLPSTSNCLQNYNHKLRNRFAIAEDYPFEDAEAVQSACLRAMEHHTPTIVGFIHGDLWFSNILVDYKNQLRMIDMKGIVAGELTTGGDIFYDYGKLLQSFLGYDAVLYDDPLSDTYKEHMLTIFKHELSTRKIDYDTVFRVTFSLVMGTFHCISTEQKHRVWDWIKSTFHSLL